MSELTLEEYNQILEETNKMLREADEGVRWDTSTADNHIVETLKYIDCFHPCFNQRDKFWDFIEPILEKTRDKLQAYENLFLEAFERLKKRRKLQEDRPRALLETEISEMYYKERFKINEKMAVYLLSVLISHVKKKIYNLTEVVANEQNRS